MPSVGIPELIIIAVVVMIVFGLGKLPRVMAELGGGIRSFKDAVTGADEAVRDLDAE